MQNIDVLQASAEELQHLLTQGHVESVGLIELYTAQIARHDDYLRAMLDVRSASDLRREAAALDAERASGSIRGPLHGIPVIIKGNIATHPDFQLPASAGSFALKKARAKGNAKLVDSLLEAGLIILGTANLSEWAYFMGKSNICGWSAMGGQTQNAYIRGGTRTDDGKSGHSNPAGSSAGSAVAVSAGYAPLSIGTETDGSLIAPSGRAALYTLKPTIGMISQEGIVPVSHTFDSAGPMTKTVYDLAVLLDVLIDKSRRPTVKTYLDFLTYTWDGLRIGTLDPEKIEEDESFVKPVKEASEQMINEIHAAYKKIEQYAEAVAQHVDLIDPKAFDLDGENAERTVMLADFARDLDLYLQGLEESQVRSLAEVVEYNETHADVELPEGVDQGVLEEALALKLSDADYNANVKHMREIAGEQGLDRTFKQYNIDVLIGPADSRMSGFASCSGYCIASLPLSYLRYNGRPFALAALAPPNQEGLLIRVQSAWEKTFGPRKPPPTSLNGQY